MNRSSWLTVCTAVGYPRQLYGGKCNRFCLAVLIQIEVKIQIRLFKFGSNLSTAKFVVLVDILSPYLRRIFKRWCDIMTCVWLYFPGFRQGICAKCETDEVWILLLKIKPAAFPSLCLRSCMCPCVVASHRVTDWVSECGGSPRGPPELCGTPRTKASWLVALPSILPPPSKL